ncbi:hypothetical protein [Stenotrophomonas maltophilia]|uniref:hypothetical protein n=1 Tax=Stenotrophomonas maltophilia TaxID=40324 RepID=UPI0011B40EA8|nr:hypothetical protein [Stenotrophomonas maltophilia]
MDNNEPSKNNGNSPWWWVFAFIVGKVLSDLVFEYKPSMADDYVTAKLMSIFFITVIVWIVTVFLVDVFKKYNKK